VAEGRGWTLLRYCLLLPLLWAAGCSDDNNGTDPTPEPAEDAAEIIYTFASNAPATNAYTVTLNGKPCYVFPAQTADIVTFGIDNSKGDVEVAITSKAAVANVKIRPTSAGITPAVNGNTITFTLTGPQYLSVEINDTYTGRPLLLFADAPETDIPASNVIRYEAGKIHDIGGDFALTGEKAVYIAPGAIVYGGLKVTNRENIRITGRGILSGGRFIDRDYRMMELEKLSRLRIEGITIVDSKSWTVALSACNDIDIQDVKIVNRAPTDDGIDIVGSQNVRIDHCFIHTADDCVAIKAGDEWYLEYAQDDVVNVSVKNSVFWIPNPDSNVFEIGYETGADTIKNILYENNDIIHLVGAAASTRGAFSIHNCGRAVVDNIKYKDIRVEDASVYLMDFRVMYDPTYSKKDTNRGKIGDVYLENISVTTTPGGTVSSIMRSYSATANIEHVWIKNMTVNGQKITRQADLNLNAGQPGVALNMPEITIE
jgi:hypothetical protein